MTLAHVEVEKSIRSVMGRRLKMPWTISEIRRGVLLVEADTQYEISSMFLRPQEFYESPFDKIKDQHFLLENYMDLYAEKYGTFSYYSDWCGFNIPSHVLRRFFKVFSEDLNHKEIILRYLIQTVRPNFDGSLDLKDDNFYLIGCCKEKKNKETIKHETAHAYYYLHPKYSCKMVKLINDLSDDLFNRAENTLREMGYAGDFIYDELQAYLATTPRNMICHRLGWDEKTRVPQSFKNFFKEFDAKSHLT